MAKTKSEKPKINEVAQEQFETLCELARLAAEFEQEIGTLSAEVDDARREAVDERRERVSELQAALLAATSDAERLCRMNRKSWFPGEKKSLKLLDAVCAFRASKKLIVANEAASIALVKQQQAAQLLEGDFLRVVETLDLEQLEKLDDKTLAAIGVSRRESEAFTVKPIKTDLAKAAAAEPAAESEAA